MMSSIVLTDFLYATGHMIDRSVEFVNVSFVTHNFLANIYIRYKMLADSSFPGTCVCISSYGRQLWFECFVYISNASRT